MNNTNNIASDKDIVSTFYTILSIAVLVICLLVGNLYYFLDNTPTYRSGDFVIENKGDYFVVKVDGVDRDFYSKDIIIGDKSYVEYKYFENTKPHPTYEFVKVVITPEKAEGFTMLTVKNGT